MVMRLYDDNGNITEEFLMAPISLHSLPSILEGECNEPPIPVVQVEKGRWHSLECLEPGTVLFESKDGKYEPLPEEDIMR